MIYRSLCHWLDLEDGHRYQAGDTYPHDGRTVSEQRIGELTTERNKAKMRLIEAVEEKGGETPAEQPKRAQRAAKGRKKAD